MSQPMFPKRPGRRKAASTPAASGQLTRVAIYTRISTDEQNQPHSLEAQRKMLESFVASQAGWVVTHRFADQKSGATLERPELQSALEAAAAGEYDVFLFYRIDRLARRLSVALELFAQFQALGVATRSATEAFDTSTPQGRVMVNILASFAEFERDSLIERIIRGNAEKASRGHWVGGRPAFGYRVADDRKTLVVVEEEAEIVRRIFQEYIEGRDGVIEITKRLNEDGIKTPTRARWKAQSVIDILRRPTYIGYIVYKDEAYEGAFESIIDRDTFDRAQKLLDARGDMTVRKSSSPEYLLTGLIRCTVCDGFYVGGAAKNRTGERYRYYRCRKRAGEKPAICTAPHVRADLLERAVVELVASTFAQQSLLERAVRDAVLGSKAGKKLLERRLKVVQAELAKLERAAERYAEAFEEGALKLELFADRLEELSKRRFALERDRSEINAQMQTDDVELVPQELLDEIRQEIGQILGGEITARKKEVMRLVIDHIDLSPERVATPGAASAGRERSRPGAPLMQEAPSVPKLLINPQKHECSTEG